MIYKVVKMIFLSFHLPAFLPVLQRGNSFFLVEKGGELAAAFEVQAVGYFGYAQVGCVQ